MNKSVLIVRMAQASKTESFYLLNSGSEDAIRLQAKIRNILTEALSRAGCDQRASVELTGDGAMLILDKAVDAHHVATNILRSAEEENERGQKEHSRSDARYFRAGIATGELSSDGPRRIGEAVSLAKAIEASSRPEHAGCSGEIRVCPETYRQLPEPLRWLYGAEESFPSPPHDEAGGKVRGRRMVVVKAAPWEKQAPPPTLNPDFARLEECFVISPIDEHNPRIAEVFEELILPACRQSNFRPLRADQIAGPERIPVITQHLSSAPLAIAYLGSATSHWNDDVMLEIGYRLSTGLPLVIISECPQPHADGRIPAFKELLPFHLLHKTIISISGSPAQLVERLAQEIQTVLKEAPREHWKTVHPIIEVKFSNVNQDLTITYVSPEAEELFGLSQGTPPDAEGMRKKFQERMAESHYKAYLTERLQILRRIQDEAMGFESLGGSCSMPVARIPIVFKDQPPAPDGTPVGYMPLIVRYTMCKGTIHLRILYLKVSASLRQDPAGYWVCEL